MRFLALLVCVQATIAFPASAGECILHPDGLNPDPGWALSRVGQEFAANSTFSYPDTTTPVRLYLIDTAVENPSSFTASNPKLTFEGPHLVRGFNDPAVSTPRYHGTQLLSLIAGIHTGVAPGTPIHVVNYDIYPNATTTTSLLNLAIIRAIQHHRSSPSPMRAVICIATSSTSTSSIESYSIGDSIDVAVAEGIPVILSAGNLGLDATAIVPSSNGTKDGVICVGASGSNDLALSSSNFGAPVDVLAPGSAVRTSLTGTESTTFVPMEGTSPAAALVAGMALAELSINGSLTPAQVETALKSSSKIPTNTAGPGVLRLTYASTIAIRNPDGPVIPATEPALLTATASSTALRSVSLNAVASTPGINPSVDSDSDGIPDMVEIFHSGHCVQSPAAPTLSLAAIEGVQHIRYKFPIAFELFNRQNPFELDNGFTWGIRCTSDFKTWQVPFGSMEKSTDSTGQNWLTATFPAGQSSCFVQIEIHPPTAVIPVN